MKPQRIDSLTEIQTFFGSAESQGISAEYRPVTGYSRPASPMAFELSITSSWFIFPAGEADWDAGQKE
jgi:hypothetical protein